MASAPRGAHNPRPVDADIDHKDLLKNRLGAFIHHPFTSLVVALLILLSVSLVMVHLTLPEDHRAQGPIELLQWLITAVFVLELSIKCYVARSYPLAMLWRAYAWTTVVHKKKTVGLYLCTRIGKFWCARGCVLLALKCGNCDPKL